MNTVNARPLGEEMLMKKKIVKLDPHSHGDITLPLKPSQIHVRSTWLSRQGCITLVITSLCTSIRNF